MGLGVRLIWDEQVQEVVVKGFRRRGDTMLAIERSKRIQVGDAIVAVDGVKIEPQTAKGAAEMIQAASEILSITMKAKIRDQFEMVNELD